MAREEVLSLTKALNELEEQGRILLLPRDPLDDKNVLLEVRLAARPSISPQITFVHSVLHCCHFILHSSLLGLLSNHGKQLHACLRASTTPLHHSPNWT